MIIRFELENFLSFNAKQSFSMIPSRLKNKTDHVFEKNDVKLLNLSAIYGANASGKTNLIRAIDLFKFIVKNALPSDIDYMYFRNKEGNKHRATRFEIEFIKDDSVYAYGIEILLNQTEIKSEWLYKLYPNTNREKLIYEREFTGGRYKMKYNENTIKGEDRDRLDFIILDMGTNTRTLLLTEMNRNKKIDIKSDLYFFKKVYDWFYSDLKVIFPNQIITRFDYMINNRKEKNVNINNIISSFDTGISGVRLEKIDKNELRKVLPKEIIDNIIDTMKNNIEDYDKTQTGTSVLRSQHEFFQITRIDNNNYIVETIKLEHGYSNVSYDFREESDGTRRLFDLLEILLNTDNNKVFVIDELDRSLHPNLTYKFMELFYEIAREKDIQLILTTHESKIMDLNLVRQDEIWFVERNNSYESILYSLDNFKERYDKRIERAYLEGRYGAVPVFSSFESFIDYKKED